MGLAGRSVASQAIFRIVELSLDPDGSKTRPHTGRSAAFDYCAIPLPSSTF